MPRPATPIRDILCPVDGSEPSAQAGAQAIAFAQWSGARVTALHVSPPLGVADPSRLAMVVDRPRDETDLVMRGWMESQFRPRASATGVRLNLTVTPGAPAQEILALAARLPADLIVMGTHGASGFEHLMLGSVAEKVLRRAPCPVLTVPPRTFATSHLPFTRVLCALDFSDCSVDALEFAMATARGAGATLTLAHVLEWPWPEPPAPAFDDLPRHEAEALSEYRRRREREALTRLEALAPKDLGDRCHAHVRHGRAYVEILRLAAEEQTDLIVLGVHGRHPVDLAVFGSTTNQVVRHATCPVLTVRR
jgi:nucleotide-binding universal stress UspA family protein